MNHLSSLLSLAALILVVAMPRCTTILHHLVFLERHFEKEIPESPTFFHLQTGKTGKNVFTTKVTKITKRKEFAALQTIVQSSNHHTQRRESATTIGTPAQSVLLNLLGRTETAKCFLPSFFFVLFVPFVVQYLVADRGCSKFFLVKYLVADIRCPDTSVV